MVGKLKSILASPWAYVLVLCPMLVGITCWRQLAEVGRKPTASQVALKATLVSDNQPGGGEATITEDDQSEATPPELAMLHKIRRDVGSPLDESIFETAAGEGGDEGAFDETYSREAAAPESDRFALPERALWRSVANEPVEPSARHGAALRSAARLLDVGAGDLEDAESYELADDLRGWANQLREHARGEAAPASTKAD